MNKDTDFFKNVPGKHAAGILSPSSNMKRWNLFLQNTFELTLREYGSDFPVRTQKIVGVKICRGHQIFGPTSATNPYTVNFI